MRPHRGFMGWCLVVCLLPGLAGCDSHEQEAEPEVVPTVTVARPVVQEVTDWDEFTGRFVPVERVEIRARVSGYVDAVSFNDGQLVRRGDLLYRIDPRPFEAAALEAEARLAAARSQLTLGEREFERATSLLRYRAASEANLEQRQQALDSARAQVMQAEAALQRSRLELDFTQVRAPQDGRIGRHLVSPGNLVSGGDASSATLLATIVTIDPIDISFDIDQAAGLRYARMAISGDRPSSRDTGNAVQLALADETGFPHRGQVVFVDNEADAGTGTIRLRARFSVPGQLLVPGVFARVRLLASLPYRAMLVPDQAVATDQSRRVVYVLGKENRLEMRQVRLGPLQEGMRVIREGLRADDEVVTIGMMRAQAGQLVNPVRTAPAGSNPPAPEPRS